MWVKWAYKIWGHGFFLSLNAFDTTSKSKDKFKSLGETYDLRDHDYKKKQLKERKIKKWLSGSWMSKYSVWHDHILQAIYVNSQNS